MVSGTQLSSVGGFGGYWLRVPEVFLGAVDVVREIGFVSEEGELEKYRGCRGEEREHRRLQGSLYATERINIPPELLAMVMVAEESQLRFQDRCASLGHLSEIGLSDMKRSTFNEIVIQS